MPSKKDLIYEALKRKITYEDFPEGRIPNEKELASELQVSRGTLRKALLKLEQNDLIERIRSRGTFVKNIADTGSKRSILCIIYPEIKIQSPFIYVFPGIEFEAKRYGYEVITISFKQVEDMTPENFNKLFTAKDFAGMLLCMKRDHIREDSPWSQAEFPGVVPFAASESNFPGNLAIINSNSCENWRHGVEYLLACGHRRIGCIASISNLDRIRRMPEKEYRRLLAANGADDSSELIVRANYDKQEIQQAVDYFLDLRNPPTALLCHSDFYAIYAYEALAQRGWEVPGDIAVMGTCGYPGSEFLEVPLSTVSYNYYDCGRQAVQLIMNSENWFGKPGPAPVTTVPGTLIERASTAIRRAVVNI